ncbi:MAG TPA: hypothetical protein VNA25_22265, partial [Phycisphaerae bacterium]|nr:hypothetical protein [Phycisphaerae bacterium]
ALTLVGMIGSQVEKAKGDIGPGLIGHMRQQAHKTILSAIQSVTSGMEQENARLRNMADVRRELREAGIEGISFEGAGKLLKKLATAQAENAALRKEVAHNEAEKAFNRGESYPAAVAEGEKHVAELRRMAEEANDVCPVQVALCADEDLDALWDGIESLVGYDSTVGCAQFIRLASEDIRNQVATIFRDQLGGRGAAEAWFIRDGSRAVPDLRRIANPDQLRLACAHRALAIAIGRSHKMGSDTMYSRLRDYHESECKRAMASLVLTIEPGDGLSLSQQRRIALQRGEETSDG